MRDPGQGVQQTEDHDRHDDDHHDGLEDPPDQVRGSAHVYSGRFGSVVRMVANRAYLLVHFHMAGWKLASESWAKPPRPLLTTETW